MILRITTVLCLACALIAVTATAQEKVSNQKSDESSSVQGIHGGILQKVGEIQVETLVTPDGISLFTYDLTGKALETPSAKGLATVQAPNNPKRYRYDLFPEVKKNQPANSLIAPVDLSQFSGQEVLLSVQLVGISEDDRRTDFSTHLKVPLTEAQQVAAAIEAQGVCPVSGGELGSMGKPIPVTIGNQTVYVCCAGCIDAVKRDPQKYLNSKPAKPSALPTTEEDADAIAAQKICPVMDEPLGGMGKPYKTIVDGQVVYLCCPGCAKLLHANPSEYLAKLTEQGVEPPRAE